MEFLADNIVWMLSVLWLIIVAAAFLYAVLAALSLWRSLKAAKANIGPVAAEVSVSARMAQEGAAGIEARQQALSEASDDLKRKVDSLTIAGRHAGQVATALRYPVRFLTGL
ncbi:MAG: hypothetical protein OEM67_12210 [Thermoleophilia bacterium]|nr:hypothetical protein [Thermoleophilia bacterium]MDH3724956.1 hypothetical protein [Thermoleophilia bacterium]